MQAAVLPVDWFHVGTADVEGGFSMPRVRLRRRPAGSRAKAVMVSWVYQRHLEMLLFHRFEGGTSGAVHKLLQRTGLGSSAFHVTRQSADDGEVTEGEFAALLDVFKRAHPTADLDALSRVRSVTLVPVATNQCNPQNN